MLIIDSIYCMIYSRRRDENSIRSKCMEMIVIDKYIRAPSIRIAVEWNLNVTLAHFSTYTNRKRERHRSEHDPNHNNFWLNRI